MFNNIQTISLSLSLSFFPSNLFPFLSFLQFYTLFIDVQQYEKVLIIEECDWIEVKWSACIQSVYTHNNNNIIRKLFCF